MNGPSKDFFRALLVFFSKRQIRRLFYLCALGLAALGEFFFSGLARRTFVFYAVRDGAPVVEGRMLAKAPSREVDMGRYVEEVLLGPVSLNTAPLFPKGTSLSALLYREGVLYLNLSGEAALPLPGGGDVFRNLATLERGIGRNFPYVEEIKLFVDGNRVSFGGFLPKI